ncbi:MAG: hypothetical protein IPO66_16270 [Rhodanobacteraceae bacterium]|nr:hypothetical protein [Rhodanobacteraceae bacterium]
MKPMGWRSTHTLHAAIQELLHYQIITQTVRGGKNRPSYYGFTFRRIEEKAGRPFDRPMPVMQPTNEWDQDLPAFCNKSFVQPVHKLSAVGAQVAGEFVQPVHKQTTTCAVGAQVRAISDGEFVQPEHSYAYMPYPVSGAGAEADEQAVAQSSEISAPKGSESGRPPSKVQNNEADDDWRDVA